MPISSLRSWSTSWNGKGWPNVAELFGWFGVAVTLAGIIFSLGRYSVRVEHLEEWRGTVLTEFKDVHGHLLRFERLLIEHTAKNS